MLQPDKLKKLNDNARLMAEQGSSQEDILAMKDAFIKQFGTETTEKKNHVESVSTSQKENTELEVQTGSQDSTLSDKNSNTEVKPATTSKKEKVVGPSVSKKEDSGFLDYLKNNLDAGLKTVSKSIYDAPGMVYDAAAAITNPIFKTLTGYDGPEASSDKLAKDLGFRNIPSETLKKNIDKVNEKINEYSAKNGGDALTALENKDYLGAVKLITGTTVQSLPIMVAAMASGGSTGAMAAIGASTASTKNAELKEEHPEMDLGTRVSNAATSGVIEAVTGHLFTGASGAVMKRILAEKGVEAGSKIISKSFKGTLQNVIEKSPLIGVFGEVVEETAVEFGNQVNDIASGIRTDFDIHAIKNAGLSATGMGGFNTLGVYGAKGYVKTRDYNKIKAVNKEVFKLRNQLENENITPENRAILAERVDRLVLDNKKLLGSELQKLNSLPSEQKKELNALNTDYEVLKSKFDEVNSDETIADDVKTAMLDELKIKAKANQTRKTEIISGVENTVIDGDFSNFEGVEPDFNLTTEIDNLPLEDQDSLKREAESQLIKELNPDGKKDMTIDNAQITERANQIYLNNKNAKSETTTTETKEQAVETATPETEAESEKGVDHVISPTVELSVENTEQSNDNQIKNESTDVLEKRQAEIEDSKNDSKEFNEIDKELEKRERQSVINSPLNEVESVIDNLIKKDKEMPNGFGSYIEKRDSRETKEVAKKYKGEVDRKTAKKDFKDAFFGNPNTWYADGLKLRESTRVFIEKGGTFKELLSSVQKEFQSDGFSEQDAANVINRKLSEITKTNETIQKPNTKSNADVRPTIEPSVQQGESDNVQGAVEPGPSEAKIEVDANINHAVKEVNKGVLAWDSNPFSPRIDLGISRADVRKGESDIKKGKYNTVPAKRVIEALAKAKEQGYYDYMQGSGGQIEKLQVPLTEQLDAETELSVQDLEEINKNEDALAKQHEEFFNNLDEATQNEILENYETRENNTGEIQSDTEIGESKNDVQNKQEAKPKPTTTERIKASQAKVDDVVNAIKGIDSIFGIKIKIDDIDGVNRNGVDMIDVIAGIVKQAVAAGIHIDEAIKKTVEHLKKTIDFDINPDDVKAKLEPKKSTNSNPKSKQKTNSDASSKTKQGKKSILARLLEGGNSDIIMDALQELETNYDIRNQEKSYAEAQYFVKNAGLENALIAVKDGLIEFGDTETFVLSIALDQLSIEIDNATNLEERDGLIKQFQYYQNLRDTKHRRYGQSNAALNFVYNQDANLKYALEKQIADYKFNDPSGKIPDDVLKQMQEIDARLKENEKLLKEAEERAKKAEDELAIKNIQEDIERNKNKNQSKTYGLTKEEKSEYNQLRKELFGVFNDVTRIATILADPKFRRYLQLAYKSVKGDFKKFSDKVVSEIGNGSKNHLTELFEEAKKTNKTAIAKKVVENNSGKPEIPTELFRYYVEQGETDIDVISELIKEDIKEDFPDAEVRDIRDALSGYGKTTNPSKDDVKKEMARLRSVGKLLSALNDAVDNINPKKSGLQRPKPNQELRELRKEILRVIDENGLDAVNLETEWKSSLQKIKQSLNNQIEDLDKQISKGEKRKIERKIIKLDQEAENLKASRDEKRQFLDDLVGKPELTDEQKIKRAENSLERAIEKLEKEIKDNDIEYKSKPTPVQSENIEKLKARKKALTDIKNEMREQAGLIEKKRLQAAKNRVNKQNEDLKSRIANRDFSKKQAKPIIPDSELNQIQAERNRLRDKYDKLKYQQELANRSGPKILLDTTLEFFNVMRAVKAILDLGLIGIQLRGFTYAELWRSPRQLAKKMANMFGAIGSKTKADKAMGLLKTHELYDLAKKLDIGMTYPDLKDEVREEASAGNLLSMFWNIPITMAEVVGGDKVKNFTRKKRKAIGDAVLDNLTNKESRKRYSIKDQLSNINPFESVERGLSTYGNVIRFEEFVRGVERLKRQGKDPLNHSEHYKDLASYIRTFSGRAKPAGFDMNQKALNVFFFSFKNAASVFQQLNPFFYASLQVNNFKEGNYKPSVANQMAMSTMFKSVASTAATMLFITAAYNAFKDDEDDELTIETDPNSSDFMKIRIGDVRYDPWGGYVPLITLYSRLLTEEVKKSDGTKYNFGDQMYGIQNRGDAFSRFIINKESPSFQMIHKYATSIEKVDKITGESKRITPWKKDLIDEEAYSLYPIFMGSVKEAVENDFTGVQSFLTAYSVFGLGNVQYYENKPAKKRKSSKMPKMPKMPSMPKMPTN